MHRNAHMRFAATHHRGGLPSTPRHSAAQIIRIYPADAITAFQTLPVLKPGGLFDAVPVFRADDRALMLLYLRAGSMDVHFLITEVKGPIWSFSEGRCPVSITLNRTPSA